MPSLSGCTPHQSRRNKIRPIPLHLLHPPRCSECVLGRLQNVCPHHLSTPAASPFFRDPVLSLVSLGCWTMGLHSDQEVSRRLMAQLPSRCSCAYQRHSQSPEIGRDRGSPNRMLVSRSVPARTGTLSATSVSFSAMSHGRR
jgi:hypothetical protein